MSSAVSLQSVLLRPDVWRGDRFARSGEAGVASGFAALDAELPDGGWPRAGLTELLCAQAGIGELSLLLPALARCAQQAPLAIVAPPFPAHAPAWQAALPLERLLFVQAQGEDVAWAAEALLGCGALGALLAWLPARVDARSLRRLQLAAESHPGPVFVFRPAASARGASPAVLRLSLAATQGALQVGILKRRGPPLQAPLCLEIARPAPRERLLARRSVPPVAVRNALAEA